MLAKPNRQVGPHRSAPSRLEGLAHALTGASVLGLILLVGLQIAARDLRIRLIVYDELVALLFVWLIFIGGGLLAGRNEHIRVDIVESWLGRVSPGGLRAYHALMALLGAAFGGVFLYSSLALFRAALRRTSPMLAWSQGWWYAPLVIGAALILGTEAMRFLRWTLGRRGPDGANG